MNTAIMCKANSGKNNNTKTVTLKVKDELLEDLLTSTPTCRKNILWKEEISSQLRSCQERTKSLDPVYATNTTCIQFRGKSKESSNNLVTKKQSKKWSTAKKTLGYKIFNSYSSSVISENHTNSRGKKIGNRLPRFEQASHSLLSYKLDSGNDFTKSLQRQSEGRIMEAATPIMVKFGPDTAHANDVAMSTDLATSVLFFSKPRQSGSHHKTKCRSTKTYRSQFRGTPAIAAGTTAADTTKQMTVLPNTALARKITTTACAARLASAQTLTTSSSNTSLATTWTAALVVPNLAQALLDVPVFPQAWQQFVKLLRNAVAEITSPSRLSKEGVKTRPTTARKTTKIAKSVNRLQEQSTTFAATLTTAAAAATAAATVARCKVAAAAISSVHSSGSSSSRTKFRLLPSLGATSFFTLLTLICLETVLLSTVSNCAKTFYMHWNTSNSIFRIDNTDHIIDVNKGNLAFEFDQVHIICPVYEPGTFENETEKYIIYNVSKVEYETCRITNADPRVIAICDKPQKLMFFTITFRPFTPQPGGLEFLPGNDYYFISTSSKDDLYRRIGGRCSTNNMKVVFKVCCAPEEKNKTSSIAGSSSGTSSGGSSSAGGINSADGSGMTTGIDNSANVDAVNTQSNINQHQHINNINTIGINGVNTGLMPNGGVNIDMSGGVGTNNGGIQMKSMNSASGTSINTNVDQFNRIPIQAGGINVMGNNIGGLGGIGLGGHGGGGIMLTPGGHGGINMISSGGVIGIGQYPGHPGQTGIRINNVASQQHHATHKNNNNDDHYDKHPNEVVKNEELTYNSGATSLHPWPLWKAIGAAVCWPIVNIFGWLLSRSGTPNSTSSTTAMRHRRQNSNSCYKNQQLDAHISPHFRSAFYKRERVSHPFLSSFVNFKYLICNYTKLMICSIEIIAVTTYIFKFSTLVRLLDLNSTMKDNATELPSTATTAANSSSSAQNEIVPRLLLDSFNSNVNQKLTLTELNSSFVDHIAFESVGLTFLSAQGTSVNASDSVSSAFSSVQSLLAVWKVEKTTSNIVLLYLPLIKYCRSQIFCVIVKVKRFR